jgi:uncharacterized protein (DUF2147 family)
MRKAFLAAWVLALAAGPAFAGDPAEGDWMIDDSARVHIAPCPGRAERLCGVLAWLKDPNDDRGGPSRDLKNPDPALRSRTILGLPFITDLKREANGRWAGGKVYNPGNGTTYGAKLHTHADGTLKFEGCLLVFCGARTWHRPEQASLGAQPHDAH